MQQRRLVCLAFFFLLCSSAFAASVFSTRIDDPKAIYVDAGFSGARANDTADSTATIQQAIDRAASGAPSEGIVFIPSGRYRITKTVYIWPGVRVFGYGETRPVFVLPDNTPGFQQGVADMVIFSGARRGGTRPGGYRVPFPPPGSVPPDPNIADANPGTFYSAMSNIDFEIGSGNPAAIAIREHAAQHASLSHMDFHIGSGLAGLTQVGNEAEDLHFFGGRYGILTEKPSPAWQFTLIDSTFEGQRESAIREHEAGLTLVRDTFRDVPIAIDIDPRYYDQLWVKDGRFENISSQVLTISDEKSPLNEIGFENAIVQNAPTFAIFRESGRKVAGRGSVYQIKSFNFGLILPAVGKLGTVGMKYEASPLTTMPAPLPSAIRPLPPTSDWVNAHTLGITGDGKTDDTAAIQKAIDSHHVLYFPSGHYVVHDTVTLKPDSILIGLHPLATQFDLPDETPAYQGVGAPKALISAPSDGTNILSGIGVLTNGINPRATGVLWMAGEGSLMDDVRFLGGHGSGIPPYNNDHTADPDLKKRWDGQYPSLWITHGGGGTFANIWTPSTFAQAGFYVSDTKTPGHVYELSNEHHVRTEIKFDHVENWEILAPQTEEEAGESPEALSIEIDASRNLLIANYHAYRVTRTRAPFPAAVRIYDAHDIHFRNIHVNAESGYGAFDANGPGTYLRVSKFPYESAIEDMTHHLQVREREFAVLDTPSQQPATVPATNTGLTKLEDGFFSISGATVDNKGKLYFVDHHEQRIYGWSKGGGLTIERDAPLDAVNLAMDASGNLLVLSSAGADGTVFTFRPGSPKDQLTLIPLAMAQHPNASVLLPVNYWNNGEFKDQLDPATMTFKTLDQMFAEDVSTPKTKWYVSADGSVMLPSGRVFRQGPVNDISGWRFSDNLDTYAFIKAAPGKRTYVSSESEDRTYSGLVQPDGSLADLKPFAERGGESVVAGPDGNVYIANGQILVYNTSGRQIREIDVPERPLQLIVGGDGNRTLFILCHHALYALSL